jgi:hypothetical protein
MAVNEHDALPGQLVRNLDRYIRVATSVVSDHKGDFLAIDAAFVVNVANCQFGPPLQLLSEGGVLGGHGGNTHGTDDCDPYFSSRATSS